MHKVGCVEANIYNGNLQSCGSGQRPSERNEIKEGEINGDCTAGGRDLKGNKMAQVLLWERKKPNIALRI